MGGFCWWIWTFLTVKLAMNTQTKSIEPLERAFNFYLASMYICKSYNDITLNLVLNLSKCSIYNYCSVDWFYFANRVYDDPYCNITSSSRNHVSVFGCFLKWWVPPFHTPFNDHVNVGNTPWVCWGNETHHFLQLQGTSSSIAACLGRLLDLLWQGFLAGWF